MILLLSLLLSLSLSLLLLLLPAPILLTNWVRPDAFAFYDHRLHVTELTGMILKTTSF